MDSIGVKATLPSVVLSIHPKHRQHRYMSSLNETVLVPRSGVTEVEGALDAAQDALVLLSQRLQALGHCLGVGHDLVLADHRHPWSQDPGVLNQPQAVFTEALQ